MFMIELNLALTRRSSWVLDTGCGTNLCNSLQGLRNVRKLGTGDLELRLGDGSRIIAEAVGIYDVTLCNGYVLILDPCYFISNVVRNIISVSYLRNLGLEIRFQDIRCFAYSDNVCVGNGFIDNGLFVLTQPKILSIERSNRKDKEKLN
ncbi:hypothetical protein CFOL_v3_21420 [Cephalotus follicularis]|uniref:Retrovirus-related Pol polyprotein from transposon TNT 1-94-like beta-barrel domain-containing protein n=1 Tax=Cephalotus follicularis TaxID=3775 RepID=A0A1Q3CCV9_CEPFO|nr:hypothetical protein CFOL_v3_21420 [Cephalotus follicularis]